MITKKRITMLCITALRKVLLFVLLTFLLASQAGTVSAGTYVWTNNSPEGGVISTLAIYPLTPTTIHTGTFGGSVFAIQQVDMK